MIFLFYPSKETLNLSLTGTSCTLMCDHCYATYLTRMYTKEKVLNILKNNPEKYQSILVSGGSNLEGKVPITEHIEFFEKVRKLGVKLNFHTGLISEEEIRIVKTYAERVSFDFVYDDNIIHNVYHLKEKTKEDFEKTYLLLRRIIGGKIENEEGYPSSRVVPHITLGLNCGNISEGDFKTIDELAYLKPTLLVIDVFIPTKGTPFENCPEPALDKVLEVIDKGVRRLTRTTLFLGCMRPFGKYRDILDIKAYELGVKGFVLPSGNLINQVKNNNEEIKIFGKCCALI